MMESDNIHFVLLCKCDDRTDYLRTRLALEREGIPFMVKKERMQDILTLGRLDSEMDFSYGPLQIRVPESLLDAAKAARESSADPENIPLKCPACGASNPDYRPECPECGLFLG